MHKKIYTGIVSIYLISIIPFLLSKEKNKQTNMTRDTGKFVKLFGWSHSFMLSLVNFLSLPPSGEAWGGGVASHLA